MSSPEAPPGEALQGRSASRERVACHRSRRYELDPGSIPIRGTRSAPLSGRWTGDRATAGR